MTGAVNGDTLDYSLATTAVQTSGVGSYPITVTLGPNPNYTVTTTDAALTVNPAVATVTANAKSKTYGDANPALDATVTGAVNGDTLDYSLATTAVQTSGVGSYPITVTLGREPELHGHHDGRGADGQPGGGDGDGERQEQDLRRRQPGARCGGDRRGQRRHARLQPGDDGGEDLGRRQLPDHRDAGHQPQLHGHHDGRAR